jgi:hypothetical protein
MGSMPTIIGLGVGIIAAVMDFSLAKSITSLIRPSTVKYGHAIVLGGFFFRFGFIGLLLWTLSRVHDADDSAGGAFGGNRRAPAEAGI